MNHRTRRPLTAALVAFCALSYAAEKDPAAASPLAMSPEQRAALQEEFTEVLAMKRALLALPPEERPFKAPSFNVAPAGASTAADGRIATGTETFEGSFPGVYWTTTFSEGSRVTWDDDTCNAITGSWSGLCAGGGPDGPAACGTYRDNMNSRMSVEGLYTGLSADDTDHFDFLYFLELEECCDNFSLLVEGWINPPLPNSPPDATLGFSIGETAGGAVVALPELGSAFDVTPYVRVTWIFQSDHSVSNLRGAIVDDIVLFNGGTNRIFPAERGFDGMFDDMWEPNDTVEQGYNVPSLAVNTTYTAVMRDEEWYRVSLPTGNAMRAIVNNFNPALDNIQIQLFDDRVGNSDGFPLRLSDSYGTTDTEQLTFVDRTAISTAAPNSGFLFLRVYSEDEPSAQTYNIRIEDLGRDDAFEPNNGPCQFTAISTNTTYDNLICGDDDVFLVNTTGLTEIDVKVEHVATWGQLYFQVIENDGSCGFPVIGNDYNPNNNVLFSTTNVSGRSSVLVRVYGSNLANANIYSLSVTGR